MLRLSPLCALLYEWLALSGARLCENRYTRHTSNPSHYKVNLLDLQVYEYHSQWLLVTLFQNLLCFHLEFWFSSTVAKIWRQNHVGPGAKLWLLKDHIHCIEKAQVNLPSLYKMKLIKNLEVGMVWEQDNENQFFSQYGFMYQSIISLAIAIQPQWSISFASTTSISLAAGLVRLLLLALYCRF